jgi:hypothetical protein
MSVCTTPTTWHYLPNTTYISHDSKLQHAQEFREREREGAAAYHLTVTRNYI